MAEDYSTQIQTLVMKFRPKLAREQNHHIIRTAYFVNALFKGRIEPLFSALH